MELKFISTDFWVCNPITEIKAEVDSQTRLRSEFQANLGYRVRPCCKEAIS